MISRGLFSPQLADFAGQSDTSDSYDRQGGQDKHTHYTYSDYVSFPKRKGAIDYK